MDSFFRSEMEFHCDCFLCHGHIVKSAIGNNTIISLSMVGKPKGKMYNCALCKKNVQGSHLYNTFRCQTVLGNIKEFICIQLTS